MVKFIALAATLLAGSASAFTPSINGRVNTALSAEKSQSLPFMNRPALVSNDITIRIRYKSFVDKLIMVWRHKWKGK